MSAGPFIRLEHVTQRFGKVTALDDVSIEIPPRKTIGLIGPDGVGKSTMLALLTGALAAPKAGGDITVLGGDMRDKHHRTKVCPKIAYMPQGLGKNLYFTLTVEENLQFFARLFGQDEQERRRRIDRLTKSTGLYNFLDRPAGKLSGGMKQKLGLCCSLIHDPDLLVLDEPTTGVDPLARRQFWDLVARIRDEQPQMGVVVATAYMDEAQRFDWLIAMDGGRILATGTPKELLERTHAANLDEAFIRLLPEERRSGHKEIVVPPLSADGETKYAIEAENLTKRSGSFTAVDHVSFRIPEGEIFGFLGSNGCGKSTTMRMLTGLLPATEGTVKLFGEPLDGNDTEVKLRQGYMTQNFSLYNELTVRQNLELCAKLYRLEGDAVKANVDEMMGRFGLMEVADTLPSALPLGVKQRLSLAAAVIHKPKIVILDEPTSGVDPVARDVFWEMIIELSRRDKVTIFVTTHFMNEAARCDRISLMHAGRSLACDTPENIKKARNAATLEEAFIGYLEDADPGANAVNELPGEEVERRGGGGERNLSASSAGQPEKESTHLRSPSPFTFTFSPTRWYSCCWRETLELLRDPIRLTLALFGAIILMFVMGYGISTDVENLSFAVLDWDRSEVSSSYVNDISGSRYFLQCADVRDYDELDRRMGSGELSLVIEIPPRFGRDLNAGRVPQIAYWLDGSMPQRAETINGYAQAIHQKWSENYRRSRLGKKDESPIRFEPRYLYNPNNLSIVSMVPAVIPLLLLMIPAILAALSIVREKEMGSIINLYVTPLTRFEFLVGKQVPYVLVSMASAMLLLSMAVFWFGVPIKGNSFALVAGLLLYCCITTGMGLVASAVTKNQLAVIFLVMIATLTPAMNYSGFITPVSSLEPGARAFGELYPATHALLISRGVFCKGLGFAELLGNLRVLLVTLPILTAGGTLLLRKQERNK
ncbi:MAG: ribosome-associated ATPase/putative transporter RbbA [bacterium]|nr:ribosome-associated ATPase/putative transporter RbbA [Candidatus Colisoma equi]